MSSEKTKFWYLRNLDAFSHLSDEEIRLITEHTTLRELRKKETIYFQGSHDDSVFLLKSGAVKITKLAPKGNEIILDIIGGGTVFGEMRDADQDEKNESAVVVEDGAMCIVKKADFDRVINKLPALATRAKKLKGLKRIDIENKLLDLLYRTVEQRLAITLIKLIEDFGVPHESGQLLNIKLTHKDFAELVASTRETVTTALAGLRDRGVIGYEGRHIIIRSVDGLRAIVD